MPPRIRLPRRRPPDGATGAARSPRLDDPQQPASNGEGPDGSGPDGGESSSPDSPAAPAQPPPSRRPKLKKLRFALVFVGLSVLAFVSWIFGIMMAVAGDLPQLESRAQFESAENSILYDINGEKIATLTNNQGRILVGSADIAPAMKQATVAIEDQRFYEHRGIDYQGIGRAVFQDILQRGATQGGSTITQQFVKNALRNQLNRTVFEKLREAALAYQLERHWDKDKILTEYLNVIYFGQGAYGIEAAAKTYFGWNHPGCGDTGSRCASQLLPWEAAMIAGLISNPSGFDPKIASEAATARRNLVLQKMADQGYLAQEEAEQYSREQPPAPEQIKTPEEDSRAPYFSSWLRQQLVDKYGAGEAFGGGLHINSTLDLSLQEEAQQIAYDRTAGVGLSSAVVVLANDTGGVRAMVGGYDYREQPFNLATQGQRQPGSAFKPFTLVTALAQGISPDAVYTSEPKALPFETPGVKAPQTFEVENYEDNYLGSASIATATTYSDNSVYAELGLQVGTENIAKTAQEMGIETAISTNPAMILGGLEQGVTPLDMAHAFQTLAHDGQRVSGTMATSDGAPIGIQKVSDERPGLGGDVVETNTGDPGQDRVETEQVISPEIAATARSILGTVVSQGTGTSAATGATVEWGKTGTTENNGDAWFVGATEDVTVAVWVGHANSVKPMLTEFGGGPVDGGTIPALIFHDVVLAYDQLSPDRESDEESTTDAPATQPPATPSPTPSGPAPSETQGDTQQQAPAPSPSGGGDSGGTGGGVSAG
ncbi:MAG: transglycosylase domain-containing protein [Actinomycetota bacterium]